MTRPCLGRALPLAEPPCESSQRGGGPVWSTGGHISAGQSGALLESHAARCGDRLTTPMLCPRRSLTRDVDYTLGLRPPERFLIIIRIRDMDWLGQLGPYQGFAYRTLAWCFLPNIATQMLLTVYYGVLAPIGLSHRVPPNDSPKRPQHYRRAFAIVVLSYLAYTLALDLLEQPPSFYSLLGVNSTASELEIKNAYKMFARKNHPDRVGASGAPLFMQVHDAYEALKHPIKRYGYDRFGFDALQWKVAENPHAMLYHGLENAMHYYVPTGSIMLVLAVLGRGGNSAYWRYVVWALVATLEACLIVGYNPLPSNPLTPLFNRIESLAPIAAALQMLPSMAPYQWVFFLRQLFVSSAIALGQVLPVLFPPPPTAKEEREREAEIARLAIALDPVVRQIIVHSAISDQLAQESLVKEVYSLIPSNPPSGPSDLELTEAHRAALVDLAPAMQRSVVQQALMNDSDLRPPYLATVHRTHEQIKERDQGVVLAGIGRDQLTPAPEELDMAARLLAIPSPPSSVFGLSRETTPEPSLLPPPFDSSVPGFNYSASPIRTSGPASPSPAMKRRPSLSPSKLSSISLTAPTPRGASEGTDMLFSPTSPVMKVKQELP